VQDNAVTSDENMLLASALSLEFPRRFYSIPEAGIARCWCLGARGWYRKMPVSGD
jgi:hypothetical protein